MNDETDLDPAILAAMRAVPRVDDATREAHIAAALDQLDAARPAGVAGRGQRWLSIAAAVAALAGGFALGQAGDDGPSPQRNTAMGTDTTNSNTTIPDTTMPPKASTMCQAEIDALVGGGRIVGDYESADGPRMIVLTDDAIVFIDATSCATVQTIPLP